MKVKVCSNCGASVVVDSEYSIVAICKECKKCVALIDDKENK
jgi:membrane protease subunit (stomatin/prohibitin family)